MRRHVFTAVSFACAALLALTACSISPEPDPLPEPAPTPAPEPLPEPEPSLTGNMIAEWITDETWQFSADGLGLPVAVTLTDGTATDDLGRTYEMGEALEYDVNGDGVPDVTVSLAEFDGNGFVELWYVWLGTEGALDGEPLAEQMVYPIARMSRCGDVVHEVKATGQGVSIRETLRHPLDPGDCATGGTWHQTRELTVQMLGGEPYPILTSPVTAWGGVCPIPGLDWLDGEGMTGIEVRSAPHPEAPIMATETETWGVFGLPEAPMLAATGSSFFGFMPPSYLEHTSEDIERIPVRVHCGFAD